MTTKINWADVVAILEKQIATLDSVEATSACDAVYELGWLVKAIKEQDSCLLQSLRLGAVLYETYNCYPKELQVREMPK